MTAPALIGNIGEFNSDKEEWKNYQKRLEIWMNINKIENDNKVNVFLVLIGVSLFELLVSLVTPDDVAGKSYNDLTKLLEDYYKPICTVLLVKDTLLVHLTSNKMKALQTLFWL